MEGHCFAWAFERRDKIIWENFYQEFKICVKKVLQGGSSLSLPIGALLGK
jgi:hypothetical protein